MDYATLEKRVLGQSIAASDGSHSGRVWRIAINIRGHAQRDSSDDRLLHLMSRVGVLARGLANDMRCGHTSLEEAAIVLDQLADLGDLSFEQWSGHR